MVRSYSNRTPINDFPKCHKEHSWLISSFLMQVRCQLKVNYINIGVHIIFIFSLCIYASKLIQFIFPWPILGKHKCKIES